MRAVGRPSLYRAEYCQYLIDHMSKGLSFDSFGATIGVVRDTTYEWVKVYPEFSDAKKIAIDKNLLFWEQVGIAGLWLSKEQNFNTTLWIFNMKNRHGWRDAKDLNVAATASRDEEVDRALEGIPQQNVIEYLRSTVRIG